MVAAASPESAGTLALGQHIGKYRLTEKLGEGGMGVVFVGVHEELGREAAIKLLHAEFSRHPEMLARFQKEAEAVSRIGHPNIVAIYDFGRLPDGSLYYVMERIRGETLRERLMREPLPEAEEIFHFISQIGRALQAAHAIGIVHRDLKPENVLIEAGPGAFRRVKVLDFGIAKMHDSELPPAPIDPAAIDVDEDTPPAGTPAPTRHLTLAGSVMGTPLYMSPEQAQALPNIDGRADLYALGAMLYEMLTGQPPFVAEETHMLLIAHVAWEVVPPSQRARLAFPPALDPFLLRALAKAPDERFADASTFVSALREAWQLPERRMTDRFTPILVPTPPPTPAPPTPQRPRRGLLALAAAAFVLVALAGVFAWRRSTTSHNAIRITPAAAPDPRSPAEREAAHALDAVLGSADPIARRDALEAIADIAHPCMLGQVLAALSDPHPEVRRAAVAAASALANLAAASPASRDISAQLRAALEQAAQRSGGIIAVEIAAARWHAGDRSTRALLEPALQARDPALRLRAALALAEPGQFQTLHAALTAAPPSTRRTLRWAAARRLLELGDTAYQLELQRMLDTPDPTTRLDAAMALGQSKRRPPDLLVALADDTTTPPLDQVLAAGAAAALGRSDQIPRLLAALAGAPPVRMQAAIALGRLHGMNAPGSVRDALSAHLRDPLPSVRATVAAALLALLAGNPPPSPTAPSTARPAAGSPP